MKIFARFQSLPPQSGAGFCWVVLALALAPGEPLCAQTADGFNPAPNGAVLSLAVQGDGRVLASGDFLALGGQNRAGIGRLNLDGTLDTGFSPQPDSTVWCFAVQPDGKMLVGGDFVMLNGELHPYLGRLNPDGSVDSSFTAAADYSVYALALQADGKILVGGAFTNLAGQVRTGLGRLNPDGSLDAAFNPDAGSQVLCLALQPDGAVLVGGGFTTLAGQPATYLGRLLSDGTLDSTFIPNISGPFPQIISVALQADNSVLIAGSSFNSVGGQSRASIARLNSDGTVDNTFDPGGDGVPDHLALQADGSVLVGGLFTQLGGQSCTNLGRVTGNGMLDPNFRTGTDDEVDALAMQADGRVLVGGVFSRLAGVTRANLGRLVNGPATQSLTLGGGTLTWMRGGTSPEVWRTSFDTSGDGVTWTTLGDGIRITGGWTLSGAPTATNLFIRARGFVAGSGTSTWFLETIFGNPPAITSQPVSRTNNAGTTATFNVAASGAGTLAYRWRKGGTDLSDGGKISGTRTATLTISNVLAPDAGLYSVVVSNLVGSVTSVVATLSVVDPAITAQPISRTNNATSVATFNVTAVGTPVLGYQWRKGGTNLSDGGKITGSRTAALTLSNVLGADAGGYTVVVTNPAGSVTSAVATLGVVDPFIATQPVSVSTNAGLTVIFSVSAAGTPNLAYQWRKNGTNIAAATTSALTLPNVQRADIAGYDAVVTNALGRATSSLATLSVNLATTDGFVAGANGMVYALAQQKDNRVLLGGAFTTLAGQTRNYLGRLNPDGSLDSSFNPGANGQVNCIAVQTNGAILVGGNFTALGNPALGYLARLNPDGSADPGFSPGAVGPVLALALQADGRILVGGAFDTLGGQTRYNLGRLNADGSLDPTFNPAPNNAVVSLAVQPDGRILAGGLFTGLGGLTRYFIGRLNADGSLDAGFNPGAGSWVYSLVVQPDGKVLAGGVFTALSGQPRSCIARLNADGSLDTGFNPIANELVYSLALQADGRILLGGNFTTVGGQARAHIARLNSDGTVDATFNPGANDIVYGLAVQTDGSTLAGGRFSMLSGQPRSYVGRLHATDAATESLTFDGTNIMWVRGGTKPEIWSASFDAFTNGSSWMSLGAGARLTNGWQLTGLALPVGAIVRARGLVADGGAGAWFVESTQPLVSQVPPSILHDGNFGFVANQFGFNVLGSPGQVVLVEGSTDLAVWVPLTNRTLGAALFYFSDPDSTSRPTRFYRVRLQ